MVQADTYETRIAVIQPEKINWRKLNRFEKDCMDGHTAYLKLLDSGEIKEQDYVPTAAQLVSVTKASRGMPRYRQAWELFQKTGGSMYAFCKTNYLKFGYQTALGMYSSLRMTKVNLSGGQMVKRKKQF